MCVSVQKMSSVCLAPVQISEVQSLTKDCLLCKGLDFLGGSFCISSVNIISFRSQRDVRQ